MNSHSPERSPFGWPWLALTAAVALHVTDEALNDFLPVYNPTVEALGRRWAWFPFSPVPSFELWLGPLILGIVILAALSPLAFHGSRGLRYFAYFLGVMMMVNGLGHIGISFYGWFWMPGVYSSPLLLAASGYLLWELMETP